MIRIAKPAAITDLEKVVHTWIDLLVEGKYDEAYALTLHDPYYQWTPELLKSVINGYGLPYEDNGATKYTVTNWQTATDDAGNHYKEINIYEEPKPFREADYMVIGDIYYDLPINGKWSDLTAIFKILQTETHITLELNEIHML